MKCLICSFTAICLLFVCSANAKNLSSTGTYKVHLSNPSNHLNCRTGPGINFPIRAHLEHGDFVQVLHVTHHKKPWFYTNLRCFVRASSSYLKWQGEVKKKPKPSKPKIIR
ncbi:MAG: hypothetical protein CMP47_10815 [Rickettsiales bacterium]|nr:hypothetical protein [Rickettsiales bacterium]